MIARPQLEGRIRAALRRARVVVLIGARQTGKTTLARRFLPSDDPNYLDLENPETEALMAQPLTALRERRGLVVVDEVQRAPDLFKTLRVLADRPGLQKRRIAGAGTFSPSCGRSRPRKVAMNCLRQAVPAASVLAV